MNTPDGKAEHFNLDDTREIKTGYSMAFQKSTTTVDSNLNTVKDGRPDSSSSNAWTSSPVSPRPPVANPRIKPRKSTYQAPKTAANQKDPKDQKDEKAKKEAPATPSGLMQPSWAKKVCGIVLMILVGLGSAYVVFAISAGSKSNSWPWGFWYVVALVFDQLVFQPVSAMLQFSLLYRYVYKKEHALVGRLTHLVIGKDIMAVVNSKLKLAKANV